MGKTMEARLDNVYRALRPGAGHHLLSSTQLVWLQRAMLDGALMHRKSSEAGTLSPHPWDNASVENERACLQPKWIGLVCHHGNGLWKQIRCRNCEGCHHAWRSKVRAIILKGCEGHRVWMWTLTIPEYPEQMEEDRYDVAQTRWHDLLRSFKKHGISFQYLRVVELQKRGTPHFHIALKAFMVRGHQLSNTREIATVIRGFAQKARFGHVVGKTMDIQAARLGGAGVASYMSKYMNKAENFYDMRRQDGRAIRRYARSRNWIPPQPGPTWRYARDGGRFSHTQQTTQDVPCDCSEGKLLHRHIQTRRWLYANQREGRWVAPTSIGDYLLQQEEDQCESQNT